MRSSDGYLWYTCTSYRPVGEFPVTKPDERLDYAERWMRDGLMALRPAGVGAYQSTIDMSHALHRLDRLRRAGVKATPTHLLVSATARALAANPDLHQIIAGVRRRRFDRVDIGLSITGETFVDPVLVIEGAGQKTVPEIVDEIAKRVPEVQEADRKLLQVLRRWGWIVPFGFLRRAVLRMLFRSATFRRNGVGTFQVSTGSVDWVYGSVFTTAGLLIGGEVRSHVLVKDGEPAVCPAMKLTLCCDHGVWDGRGASRFLAAVQTDLEREDD
jgi:pyruvate/2-oxoglutarate dehydrogenase complex dihydrolipoamide acyltransferase (E2) component